MQQQQALFFDRIEDAIGAVINACGGRKAFAVDMFPDKALRDAHNLLDAMLNPERRERFSPDQLMYVLRRGKQAGCHALMAYMAQDVGYTVPEPLHPVDQESELQRSFIAAVQELQQIQQQLQRVQQQQVRRVV